MLSDEEKEALRNFKSEYETCDHYSSDLIIELDDAEIILNLIEKQQKEIEEVKEKNKILEAISLSFNEIQDRDKKWEYKIKAKIEEVDYKMIAHQDVREAVKSILQSLLEKE